MNDTIRSDDGTPDDALEWEYRVPLLTSRFMLADFARVIALSLLGMAGAVALIGWVAEGEPVLLPWHVFALTGGIMSALFVLASLLLGNRIDMTFRVGPDGVRYATGSRARGWNRAAVLAGLLAGSPSTAGAGMLASSTEQGGWAWAELHRAVEHPAERVISLRNSWRTVLRLHCTRDGYEAVRAAVADGIAAGAAARSAAGTAEPARRRRPWHSYAAAVLAPAVAAVLVTAWPWLGYADGMRWIVFSVVLLVAAGLTHGVLRGVLAIVSLLPTGYVVYLTVAEMLSTTAGALPGEYRRGWAYDPGLLAVTLAGEALLVGLALWRLFGADTAALDAAPGPE